MKPLLAAIVLLALPSIAYPEEWYSYGNDIDVSGSFTLSADGGTIAIWNADLSLRVYRNLSGAWTQIGDSFSWRYGTLAFRSFALSADGNEVAIGYFPADIDGTDLYTGIARVFEYVSDNWVQIGSDIDGESLFHNSGSAISLSSDGSVVAFGAQMRINNNSDPGHVRVYRNLTGVWTKVGGDIVGNLPDDWTGRWVRLNSDGSIVAVGASGADGDFTRVFEVTSETWTQIGSDVEGSLEDLSLDGNALAADVVPQDLVHLRVYRNVSGTWSQVGNDFPEGGGASMSSDGNVVAVSFSRTENNAVQTFTRVYEYSLGDWRQVGSDIDGIGFGAFGPFLSADGTVVATGNSGDGLTGYTRASILGYPATTSPVVEISTPIPSLVVIGILQGEPQAHYRIQKSMNLVDWFDFSDFLAQTTQTEFQDPEFDETKARFYRVVSP